MKISFGQGKIQHWYVIALFLMIYDFIVSNLSYLLALWLRFDCQFSSIPGNLLDAWISVMPFYGVAVICVFMFLKLYRSIWRFASYKELIICVLFYTFQGSRMPVPFYVIGFLLQFLFTLSIRFSYRFVTLIRGKNDSRIDASKQLNVMIIGAGNAGQALLRDLNTNHEYIPCCFIDDNPNKWGRYIDGVPVFGGKDKILLAVKKFNIKRIFVAIPSCSPKNRSEILNICKDSGCKIKSLPGLYQLASSDVKLSLMEDVNVIDLLGRDPIKVDMREIFSFIEGKVVLVTGGGGSIGSELCRQIASHHPKQLIVFDIYENNAHAIQLELLDKYPNLNLKVLIGSVRDSGRLQDIFSQYKPNIVYHAAAHKHVPRMEWSPCEAIKNNAIGTYKTAFAAMINGCDRFVLISTDKAVNPTNIMGASKRICEMVIQSFDRKIKSGRVSDLVDLHMRLSDDIKISVDISSIHTEFVAVRFGNVLGSNGSVVPRFKEQIRRGGPVTVTHPDIVRFFMTIPEAVSLVLQAGTYAHGGEIFVLDMGDPVKIDDLARNLIKLSGFRPETDIKIEYCGLRPGEKLFEEKLMSEEGIQRTNNDLIYIGHPIDFDEDVFLQNLERLMFAAYDEDNDSIRYLVADMVPTYSFARN